MFYGLCKCFYNVVHVTITVVNDETHPQLLYYWWQSWSLLCYFRAALIDMRTADGRQAHLHWRHLPPPKKLPIWSCPGLGQTRSVQCSEKEQLQDNFLLVSASTFLFLPEKTSAGARAASVTSANSRHPRATIARSESLDCKDENRLFLEWSQSHEKVIFFFSPSLPWCLWDTAAAAAAGACAHAVSEDGTVRGEMRRGGQRNFRAAQAFCPELSLQTWTGA